MKTTLYSASSRGHAEHGWLESWHTFSFANYYNPARVHFGALRVINDDIIDGGQGFGTHPHNNMEIITIPLYGDLEHKDSMGSKGVIKAGEVQVMSAGSGLTHSEYNANEDRPVGLFQIWVFSDRENVEPRYDQKAFDFLQRKNELVQIVGPKDDVENTGLWIYQNAWFSVGAYDKGQSFEYKVKREGNGVFAMVIDGQFSIEGKNLNFRDGLGISGTDSFSVVSNSENARILLMDVPMIL